LTAFVLDCSVTMAWVFPDEASEATDRLRESMIRGGAFVPALWPVEVGNVLLHRNPSWANRRGRMVPDLRESRSVAHRSRSCFHVPRMGRRACARRPRTAARPLRHLRTDAAPVVISAAVEGSVDEAVARRLVRHVGGQPGKVYGKGGKPSVLNNLEGYNNAGRHFPWFVLVDLDRDCAPMVGERRRFRKAPS